MWFGTKNRFKSLLNTIISSTKILVHNWRLCLIFNNFIVLYWSVRPYFLTETGCYCVDSGRDALTSIQGCRLAIPFLKTIYRNIHEDVKKDISNSHPKGCYVFNQTNPPSFWVYWNMAIDGSKEPNSRQVCNSSKYTN